MLRAVHWLLPFLSVPLLLVAGGRTAAFAAPALVQTNSVANGGNDFSISVSYATPPTAGNLLIAIAGNRTIMTLTSIPAGWSTAIDQVANGPGQIVIYKVAGLAEPSDVTINYSGAGSRFGLHIYEYSGLGASPTLDQVTSNTGSGTSLTSGSITTTGFEELLLVGFTLNDNPQFNTWSNSFVERNDFQNGGATSFQSTYGGADRTAATPGSYSTTATVGSGAAWRGQIVSFLTGADLAVTKTVDDGGPNEGDTIVYTVVVANGGPDGATGVELTDLLPAGVTYVSDTTTQGSYVSGTGVWTVGAVANAAADTLTITATVDAGTAGTTIGNTASVTASDQADPTPANDSDSADITVFLLSVVKRAFLPDGTPVTSGYTVRKGQDIKYLIYINNPELARTDLSIEDILDPTFGYQAGTIKTDNSVASCAADTCTAVEESAIFSAVDALGAGTDAPDGDEVSYNSVSKTIHAGDGSAANAQLDIMANSTWAILFTVKMQ